MPGPASATATMSRLGWRRLPKCTGTGLAQPKRNGEPLTTSSSGRMMLPKGSMWGIGFNVSRPARLAVSSPSRFATTPCAISCRMIENRIGGAMMRIL